MITTALLLVIGLCGADLSSWWMLLTAAVDAWGMALAHDLAVELRRITVTDRQHARLVEAGFMPNASPIPRTHLDRPRQDDED